MTERRDDAGRQRARELWVRLLLYPTHTLPTAAAPVLVGVGLAARDGVLAVLPALAAFVGSWMIHVGGVFLDNHELLRRHADVVEHPELTRAVQDGTLRLAHLRWATAACFLLALLPGAWLVALGGAPAFWLGVLGVLASAGYAGSPLAYARRGLADVLFFAMFGVLAVAGTYYAQLAAIDGAATAWARLPLRAFLVGLPVGALVTCVLVIDDLRDAAFDRRKAWRTPAARWGASASRAEFTALLAFAYASPWFGWLLAGCRAWILLPVATLPVALGVLRAVWRSDREGLVPMTPRMSMVSFVYAGLFALGLAAR